MTATLNQNGVFESSHFAYGVSQIIGSWLYYTLMESSATKATLGKMALGIYVTDLAGKRLTFGRATGRYFGILLSWLTLGIGFVVIIFTDEKQALQDILAGALIWRR